LNSSQRFWMERTSEKKVKKIGNMKPLLTSLYLVQFVCYRHEFPTTTTEMQKVFFDFLIISSSTHRHAVIILPRCFCTSLLLLGNHLLSPTLFEVLLCIHVNGHSPFYFLHHFTIDANETIFGPHEVKSIFFFLVLASLLLAIFLSFAFVAHSS
jgi:hypothetical protein